MSLSAKDELFGLRTNGSTSAGFFTLSEIIKEFILIEDRSVVGHLFARHNGGSSVAKGITALKSQEVYGNPEGPGRAIGPKPEAG